MNSKIKLSYASNNRIKEIGNLLCLHLNEILKAEDFQAHADLMIALADTLGLIIAIIPDNDRRKETAIKVANTIAQSVKSYAEEIESNTMDLK